MTLEFPSLTRIVHIETKPFFKTRNKLITGGKRNALAMELIRHKTTKKDKRKLGTCYVVPKNKYHDLVLQCMFHRML